MSLFKRFVFYFIGVGIGILLLYYFIGGSGASCEMDYLPDARVLKNIRNKERIIEASVLETLEANSLDTAAISAVLRNGDVKFNESDTSKGDCNIYVVKGKASKKKLKITFENCEEKATVQKVEMLKD